MKKISEPIVFFGSGPVAAESLQLLTKSFTIEAVITKPRPVHHKGDVPVLRVAEALQLPTYTVTNKASLDTLVDTKKFASRLAILIDFGIIVSQHTIDSFPKGIINSHFSLLPEWRGADPITFAVLSGQKTTGISLMLLTAGMDEGPLLAQSPYTLTRDITAPALTHALIGLSHESLATVVPNYLAGKITPVAQDAATLASSASPTYSRKLTKEDGILDFTKPAAQLEREIRAFIEWPKSRTKIGPLEIIITRAHVINHQGTPGAIDIIDRQPVLYTSEQALAIDMLKPAGKKEMTGEAFLAGYRQLFSK